MKNLKQIIALVAISILLTGCSKDENTDDIIYQKKARLLGSNLAG